MDASITASGGGASKAAADFQAAATVFAASQCARTGLDCTDAACGTATACMENYHVSDGGCVACQLGMTRGAGDPTGGGDTACTGTATGCLPNFYQNGTSPNACNACSAGATIAAATFSGLTHCAKPGGYTCSGACTTNTGCATGYVQTAGNATDGGVCAACSNGATKPAAIFAGSAAYGTCTKTGHTFAAGVAAATGCAANYAVSAGNTCTSCALTAEARAGALLFANATSSNSACTKFIISGSGATAVFGCSIGSIQLTSTITTAAVAEVAAVTGDCAVSAVTAVTEVSTGTCGVCTVGAASAAAFTSTQASWGTCALTGTDFDKNVAIGCAADYIQTDGTADGGTCARCQGGANANSGTRASSKYFNIAGGWGACTLAGVRFPTAGNSATGNVALGCAQGFVQTSGANAANAVCTQCMATNSATGVTTVTQGFGATTAAGNICVKDGYTYAAGSTTPTGCADGYIQTAGSGAADGVCTRCTHGGDKTGIAFAADTWGTCASTGYAFLAAGNSADGAKATGCAANYVQTAGGAGAGLAANECTLCPFGFTRANSLSFHASNFGTCVKGTLADAYTFAVGSVAPTCKADFHVESNTCVACNTGTTRTAGDLPSGVSTACVGTATGCGINTVETAENTCTTCSNNGKATAAAWNTGGDDRALCMDNAGPNLGYYYPTVATYVTAPTANAAAVGCIANYVQTAGDAAAGTCTACVSGTRADALPFGATSAAWACAC